MPESLPLVIPSDHLDVSQIGSVRSGTTPPLLSVTRAPVWLRGPELNRTQADL